MHSVAPTLVQYVKYRLCCRRLVLDMAIDIMLAYIITLTMICVYVAGA